MKTIADILSGIRPEFDFSTSDDFIRDGMLDSFDVMMLVAELDETFGISIDGLSIVPENFRNADAIEAIVRQHGASP